MKKEKAPIRTKSGLSKLLAVKLYAPPGLRGRSLFTGNEGVIAADGIANATAMELGIASARACCSAATAGRTGVG
jgi:hypothetical protein